MMPSDRLHDWPLRRGGYERCTQCGLPRNLAEDTGCLAVPIPSANPNAVNWTKVGIQAVIAISAVMLLFCLIGLLYSLVLNHQAIWRMFWWVIGSGGTMGIGMLLDQLRRMPQTP